MSILSYPDRGPWGKSSWRGNCSGYIYKDLFERLKPKTFVDPMVGSGTSVEVAQEMGIESYGLDLHQGFNILRHSILERVGKPVDMVLSHPPYGGMIVYSGEVWGDTAHPDDLSRCVDDEDFHTKLQLALMNQREATRPGGYYGTIIGDLRKDGRYCSYQAEALARMPSSELVAVLIKAQHNTLSERKSYGRMALPFINHEFVLLWERKNMAMFSFLKTVANQAQARLTGTWRNVVKQCLMGLGGTANLARLYSEVESKCDKAAANPHWKEKVRQVLNTQPAHFKPVERGVWTLA
ncbi:MAG: hypothetical protein Q8K22_11120 [Rhodoferax sp.]|nr:hypothetical protein [Rhodoferax sp.]